MGECAWAIVRGSGSGSGRVLSGFVEFVGLGLHYACLA